jgi:hypothetical protein
MPTNKDLKRLVRARMEKTGESYTAARKQVVGRRATPTAETGTTKSRPSTASYATIAGMSDASLEKATGRTWKEWVALLDADGAAEWPHRRIADMVSTKHGAPDWWCQTVTVGYERIKGLRTRGQSRDGTYRATRSKVFPVAVDKLYSAFANARTRKRWLPGVDLTVRTSTPNKSMRMSWPDGTSVVIGFYAKGEGKSQVALEHGKLTSASDVAARKAFWGERLAALAEILR